MGLPGLFEYRNAKGCNFSDSGLRFVFHLLPTLALIDPGPSMDNTIISDQRLELVCDDGTDYVLVLVEFKVG